MNAHLLTLADLHAAAPGVLDVVFGPDGDFEGAPRWAGPMTSIADPSRYGWLVWGGLLNVSVATHDGHWPYSVTDWRAKWALDLRIPSVAARLAGLCNRAMLLDEMEIDDATTDVFSRAMWSTARVWGWRDGHAAFLASLTLALAPRIAALDKRK